MTAKKADEIFVVFLLMLNRLVFLIKRGDYLEMSVSRNYLNVTVFFLVLLLLKIKKILTLSSLKFFFKIVQTKK